MIKKIVNLLLLVVIFASCSDDFLNIAPQHYPSEATFFKTKDQFEQAINGAYSSLRGISARQGYLMGEMRSDNTHYTLYKADRGLHIQYRENIADFVVDDQNQWTNEMYYSCYYGILRTNKILAYIAQSDFDAEFQHQIIGQAKFLRAFFYFQLVQCFGDVCLYLDEVTGFDNAFLPRSPVAEVYNRIIADVTDAIDILPAVTFPQNGSATKGAAKMLYAYVLMTKPDRDYSGAEAQLKDVLGMGYALQDNYADVFDTSKKNGRESIFEIQYQMGDQGQQSNWLYYFIPKTTNAEIITGVPDCSTLLTGGWNVPTPAMIDSYEEGDRRLDPSIAVAVGSLDAANALVVAEVLPVGDPKIADYDASFPFINKYRHAHSKQENTDDNWPVYRYADALLLLAECLVEQGRAAEAVPYVNQVRSRAGLPDVTSVTADVVANERRHELAFENHRWYDLIRTGKAIEVMTAYGQYIKTIDLELPERTYQIKPEYLLYPIPYRELQINDLLEQNPGY